VVDMKTLVKTQTELKEAGRCDIDFHLPSEYLADFASTIIHRVDAVAQIVKEKRNPSENPDEGFIYIDISSVDVAIGRITNPQKLIGSEAPSRARKVVSFEDVIISTCRPTRGAIALVPKPLNKEICSTGFSVVRATKEYILPEYLHWALRLPSTLEQFRKWSTGSSYPAILDEDVAKTLIPVPDMNIQQRIISRIIKGLETRDKRITLANLDWIEIQKTAKLEIIKKPPQLII